MPTIRATVTVDDAMPYRSRGPPRRRPSSAASRSSPKPAPNTASGDRGAADRRVRRSSRPSATRPTIDAPRPISVTSRSDSSRTAKPGHEGADRRRAGERPEREPLLVGPAVQHPVDEHRAADDRRREAVARSAPETSVADENDARAEQPRVEERVADPEAADDRQDAARRSRPRRGPRATSAGSRPRSSGSAGAEQRQGAERAERGTPRTGPRPARSTRPARRGVSQPLLAAHAIDERDDARSGR